MKSVIGLSLVILSLASAMTIMDRSSIVTRYGFPRRFIFNSTENRDMHRFANMESLPMLMRNPVPYFFIDMTRQGTHFLDVVDYGRRRTISYWRRFVNFIG